MIADIVVLFAMLQSHKLGTGQKQTIVCLNLLLEIKQEQL